MAELVEEESKRKFLKIGDIIALYCVDTQGYVFCDRTSAAQNTLFLYNNQDINKPANVPNPQALAFQVRIQNRFRLSKKYRSLLAKRQEENIQPWQLDEAKTSAEAENQDNIIEQSRLHGKPVNYGTVIQLRHIFSNKYVHVDNTRTSKRDKSKLEIHLLQHDGKAGQFRLLPRYKVNAEGEPIRIGDQVIFQSIKTPGQFLHASPPFTFCRNRCSELNLGVDASEFTICHRFSPDKSYIEHNFLWGGAILQVYHRHLEAYLSAEGPTTKSFQDSDGQERNGGPVHLRVRPADLLTPRTLYLPSSCFTLWQVEDETSIIKGGLIKWEQRIRIRHLATRMYLAVDADSQNHIYLTDQSHPNTVFRLHARNNERGLIGDLRCARIEHVLSGLWIHGEEDEDYIRLGEPWLDGSLKKVTVTRSSLYMDAFDLRLCSEYMVLDYNFLAGVVPLLKDIVSQGTDEYEGVDDRFLALTTALKELKAFLLASDKERRNKRKMFRELGLVDLLVGLLRSESVSQWHVLSYQKRLFEGVYDVLYMYIESGSTDDALYLAQFLDFFLSQIKLTEGFSLHVTTMMVALIKDRRQVVERITLHQIDTFISLLLKCGHHRYIQLLSALCVVDGLALPENQSRICDQLIGRKKYTECLLHVWVHGQEVMVSKGSETEETTLEGYIESNEENLIFLDKQLKLYQRLCHGRNQHCIDAICNNSISWDVIMRVIKSKKMRDDVKAMFMDLIIVLYIDVGENTPFHQISTNTYDNNRMKRDEHMIGWLRRKFKYVELERLNDQLQTLESWISEFLKQNQAMSQSNAERNILIFSVVKVMHALLSFGFIQNHSTVEWKTDILKILNSSTNWPTMSHYNYNTQRHASIDSDMKKGCTAFVEAKYEAVKTLELIMDMVFQFRVEKLVAWFKEIEEHYKDKKGHDKEQLVPLLDETYVRKKTLWRLWDPKTACLKELEAIFTSTEPMDVDLVEKTLLGLATHEHPEMTAKSLELLKRLYTCKEDVINAAREARLMLTQSSLTLYRTAQTFMPLLHRLLNVKLYEDQMHLVSALLDTRFKQCCRARNDDNTPDFIGQQILIAHDIVPLLMSILHAESRRKTKKTSEASRTLVKNTLHLLQLMSKDNGNAQKQILTHLDTLLAITIAPVQLAETLKELFHHNAAGAWRITSQQIKKIVGLVSTHQERVPGFVQVLSNLIMVADEGAPIRRSQTLVMKHILEGYPRDAHVFERPATDRRQILLLQQGTGMLEYFLHLLNLLVYCGNETRGSIRSFCQNVLSLTELLGLLANPEICVNYKRPLIKFLNCIYLQSPEQLGQSVKIMVHSSELWRFLSLVNSDLEFCLEELEKAKVELPPIPADMDTCYFPDQQASMDIMKCKLFYMIDAVFDFLVEFKNVYQPHVDTSIYPDEGPILNGIVGRLILISKLLARSIPSSRHYSSMRLALQAMMTLVKQDKLIDSCMTAIENERNLNPVGRKMPALLDIDGLKEIRTNELLQTFVKNVDKCLVEPNTLKAQLQITDSDLKNREYATGTTGTGLPIGQAFQGHLGLFQFKKSNYIIKPKMKIVLQHLQAASKKAKEVGCDPLQVDIIIRYLRILRATMHNIIVTLPHDWDLKSRASSNKKLKVCRVMQDFYVNEGLVHVAFALLNMQSNTILHEVLALICSLLFNANHRVQDACLKYFESTREEVFFMVLIEQFHRSAAIIKERRVFAAIKRKKLQSWTMEAPKEMADTASIKTYNLEAEDIGTEEPEHLYKSEDDNAMTMMLAVLGTLCDGQHRGMQNYLRYQPDNLRSFDVVAEATSFLELLCLVDEKNIKLVKQIFTTLNEICQGNQENRVVTLNNKVVDYINTIIRSDFSDHCPHTETLNLYKAIADFLMSLLEENSPDALKVAQEVAATIDRKAILRTLGFCYKIRRDKVWPGHSKFTLWKSGKVSPIESSRITLQQTKKAKTTAIRYYIIYSRLRDVANPPYPEVSHEDNEDALRAILSYENAVASVEIIKDNHLQNVYFQLPKQCQIREEVKERLLWNIDRSSPTNKIRDFVRWARVIKEDILYNRKVLANPLTMFISRQWRLWNYIIIGLSLIINIMMLVTWEAQMSVADIPPNATSLPAAIDDPTPRFRFIQDYDLWLLVFGIIHNISSVVLLISYFLIHNPKMPKFTAIKDFFRTKKGKEKRSLVGKRDHCNDINPGIFTLRTIFILTLVVSSFAGTITNGYFFAVHLLNIVNINELLKGVIKAVTLNGKSLIWVAILGIIFLYLYGLIAFAFFRPSFDPQKELYCDSLIQCTVTILRYGMVGDINEMLTLHPLENSFANFGYLVVYQFSFFIFFSTIGLNIIFGIIVDTFSELRDLKWTAEKDMQELCFICSRQSYDFEHFSSGFRFHTKKEHNMWNYIYYFLYLVDTNPNDYSALDVYVAKRLEKDQYDFFPISKALSLDHHDEETGESKLDTIAKDVNMLKASKKDEDAKRQLQVQRYENMRWREDHLRTTQPPVTPRNRARRKIKATSLAHRASIAIDNRERPTVDLDTTSVYAESPGGTLFNLGLSDYLEQQVGRGSLRSVTPRSLQGPTELPLLAMVDGLTHQSTDTPPSPSAIATSMIEEEPREYVGGTGDEVRTEQQTEESRRTSDA